MAEYPTTDNHDFARPDVTVDDLTGEWGDVINQDITDILEERVPIVDTAANRDTYAAYSDAVFIASDSGQVSLGNGTSWDFRGVVPNDSDVIDAIDEADITPASVTTNTLEAGNIIRSESPSTILSRDQNQTISNDVVTEVDFNTEKRTQGAYDQRLNTADNTISVPSETAHVKMTAHLEFDIAVPIKTFKIDAESGGIDNRSSWFGTASNPIAEGISIPIPETPWLDVSNADDLIVSINQASGSDANLESDSELEVIFA